MSPEMLFGIGGVLLTVVGWFVVLWSWVASAFAGGLAMAGGGMAAVLLAIFGLSVDGCQQQPNGDVFSKSGGFGCYAPAPLGVTFDPTPITVNAGEKATVYAIVNGGTSPLEFEWEWSAKDGWGYGYTQLPTFTFTPPVEEIDVTYVVVVGVTDAEGQFATAEKDVTVKGAVTTPVKVGIEQ